MLEPQMRQEAKRGCHDIHFYAKLEIPFFCSAHVIYDPR